MIILYGAPGSGKGTQAKLLEDKFGFKFLDFGQNFREFAKKSENQNDVDYVRACRVKSDLEKGNAIKTEDLYYIIQAKIESYLDSGLDFILDKPGSLIEEAKWLSNLIKKKKINCILIHLELPIEKSLERISQRYYIPGNPNPFPSKEIAQETLIKSLNSTLVPYQRPEDTNKETTIKRIHNLYDQHNEIIEVYKKVEIPVYNINANGTVDEVFKKILKVIA
jgi:adenylate kinase